MPATGGRRGRRDNGLVAAEYTAVGDIDPRIGEHLLEVLATEGIAAYLQPSTDLHPITRTTSLPARPTDRLFVDRRHAGTARDHLRQVPTEPDQPTPGERRPDLAPSADPDVDSAFREIIAGFHRDVEPTATPWPASEDITLDEPRLLPSVDPAVANRTRSGDSEEPSLLDALDTFGAELPDDSDDDDEGYTPPPPPPLPRISAAATVGVLAIVAGLLLFVFPELLPLDGDTVLIIAFGSIVAGFGTLIWRLRPGDEDDDDLDDGARV